MKTSSQVKLPSIDLDHQTFPRRIADRLEQMIIEQDLQPGSRLPSERDLAQRFEVNRATVSDAINLLAQRGLVRKKLGSGAYVDKRQGAVVAESIERFCVSGNCSHEDLLALREVNEPEIAALAARHATRDDLKRLAGLIEQIEKAAEDANDVDPELDAKFHEALGVATHNDLFAAIFTGLHKVLRVWLTRQYETRRPASGRTSESIRLHRAIYEAVAVGDAADARRAMDGHMTLVRETSHLEKEPTGVDE